MFPSQITLATRALDVTPAFGSAWKTMMEEECHQHPLWQEQFVQELQSEDPRLAFQLAVKLGLADEEIERIQPLPEAQAYTDDHYRQCATGDFEFALGMICLIEEFTTPEFTLIFRSFLRTCREGMGIRPDDFVLKGGAEYFTANIADDERHREEMPRLVAATLGLCGVDLNNPSEINQGLSRVKQGVRQSTNLRQEFFAGIHRFVHGGGTFKDLR